MNAPNLHLNLLRSSEQMSSSPVRVRVMLPILAILGCVGCLVWWGLLFGQLMVVKSQMSAVQSDLDSKKAQHGEILKNMMSARDLQAELDQLTMYSKGRLTYGKTLAKLAEVMPLKIQLLSIDIPEPPLQDLTPPNVPRGRKVPPLLGPTGTVETVSLRLMGRTARETPVLSLIESLEGADFTNMLKIVKNPQSPEMSPKIHSFRQDVSQDAAKSGARLLAFDIEYRCQERRFEK